MDDQATLKQAEQVKEKVSQPAQNVSGTQTYQDPTKVQSNDDTTSNTYDASLDELNGSSSKTSQDQSNNSAQTDQQTQDANVTISNKKMLAHKMIIRKLHNLNNMNNMNKMQLVLLLKKT